MIYEGAHLWRKITESVFSQICPLSYSPFLQVRPLGSIDTERAHMFLTWILPGSLRNNMRPPRHPGGLGTENCVVCSLLSSAAHTVFVALTFHTFSP